LLEAVGGKFEGAAVLGDGVDDILQSARLDLGLDF